MWYEPPSHDAPDDSLSGISTWLIFLDKCSYVHPQLECIRILSEIAHACGAPLQVKLAETHQGFREKTNLSSPTMPINGFRGKDQKFAAFIRRNRHCVEIMETGECAHFREELYRIIEESLVPMVEQMIAVYDDGAALPEDAMIALKGKFIEESGRQIKTQFSPQELFALAQDLRFTTYLARRYLPSLQHARSPHEISFRYILEHVVSQRRPISLQIIRDSQLLWDNIIKPHRRLKAARHNRGEASVLSRVKRMAARGETQRMVTFVTDDTGARLSFKAQYHGTMPPLHLPTKRAMVHTLQYIVRGLEQVWERTRHPLLRELTDDLYDALHILERKIHKHAHMLDNVIDTMPGQIDPAFFFVHTIAESITSVPGYMQPQPLLLHV